jgi:hypothetical protein
MSAPRHTEERLHILLYQFCTSPMFPRSGKSWRNQGHSRSFWQCWLCRLHCQRVDDVFSNKRDTPTWGAPLRGDLRLIDQMPPAYLFRPCTRLLSNARLILTVTDRGGSIFTGIRRTMRRPAGFPASSRGSGAGSNARTGFASRAALFLMDATGQNSTATPDCELSGGSPQGCRAGAGSTRNSDPSHASDGPACCSCDGRRDARTRQSSGLVSRRVEESSPGSSRSGSISPRFADDADVARNCEPSPSGTPPTLAGRLRQTGRASSLEFGYSATRARS